MSPRPLQLGMRWGGTVWIQLKRPVCSPVRRTVSSAGA